MATRDEIKKAAEENKEEFNVALPFIKICGLRVKNIIKNGNLLIVETINLNKCDVVLKVESGKLYKETANLENPWQEARTW